MLANMDGVVCVVTRLQAGPSRNRVSLPGRDKRFISASKCPDRPSAHPSPYSMRTAESSPEGKASGT
jgi:hypothetical protein